MNPVPGCELCGPDDPVRVRVVVNLPECRVLRVLDVADYPAFYRVVWNEHVSEFSDLSPAQRSHCMEAVTTIERALRTALEPRKVNIASLGNQVPHLHWHVVARFDDDSHFPHPIWGERQRDMPLHHLDRLRASMPAIDRLLDTRFSLLG